jgi:aminomethyltransferase
LRVGIKVNEGVARPGAKIKSSQGETIGQVTSAAFGPSVGAPIALGYVARGFEDAGTPVKLTDEGAELSAEVLPLPFVPHRHAGVG